MKITTTTETTIKPIRNVKPNHDRDMYDAIVSYDPNARGWEHSHAERRLAHTSVAA